MTGGRTPRLSHEAALRLTTDTDPWLSCDDCFEQIDEYIDQLLTGVGQLALPLRRHLIGCSACGEEAWSLLRLAADERGLDLAAARARLERDLDCSPPPAWLAPELDDNSSVDGR